MTFPIFICTILLTLYGRTLGIDGGIATGLSIKNLFIGLCLASIVVSLAMRAYQFDLPLSVFAPFGLALLYALASIGLISFFSLRSNYSEIDALISLKSKLVDPLLMLLIGYFAVQTIKNASGFLIFYAMMITAGCALTIIDVFNIPDLGLITASAEDGRIQGFIGSAGEFATIVACTIPILLYGISWNTAAGRIVCGVSFLLMLTCLLLAATRAPFIGLIGAWLVYLALRSHNPFFVFIRGAVVFIPVILLVVSALQLTPVWSVISDRFLTGTSSGSLFELSSGRTAIWMNILLDMWKYPHSFIIGMGWDVYFQAIGHRYATHNIFLDRFYALGLIGILWFSLAYLKTFRLLFYRAKEQTATVDRIRFSAGLALVVFLISAMFADLEVAEFFTYAIVGLGLRCISLRDINKSDTATAASNHGRHAFHRQGNPGNSSFDFTK